MGQKMEELFGLPVKICNKTQLAIRDDHKTNYFWHVLLELLRVNVIYTWFFLVQLRDKTAA